MPLKGIRATDWSVWQTMWFSESCLSDHMYTTCVVSGQAPFLGHNALFLSQYFLSAFLLSQSEKNRCLSLAAVQSFLKKQKQKKSYFATSDLKRIFKLCVCFVCVHRSEMQQLALEKKHLEETVKSLRSRCSDMEDQCVQHGRMHQRMKDRYKFSLYTMHTRQDTCYCISLFLTCFLGIVCIVYKQINI